MMRCGLSDAEWRCVLEQYDDAEVTRLLMVHLHVDNTHAVLLQREGGSERVCE